LSIIAETLTVPREIAAVLTGLLARNVEVWLIGTRANGMARDMSDWTSSSSVGPGYSLHYSGKRPSPPWTFSWLSMLTRTSAHGQDLKTESPREAPGPSGSGRKSLRIKLPTKQPNGPTKMTTPTFQQNDQRVSAAANRPHNKPFHPRRAAFPSVARSAAGERQR
jgi:hypothetical protein